MKRPLIVAAAVAALSLSCAGVAVAQDQRQPITVVPSKACGTVTLTFTNPNTDVSKTHGFRWNAIAGKVSTADGARTGLVSVPPGKTVKETIRFDEDEFNGEAAVTVAVAFGPDSDVQPRIADIYPVDTDCALPTAAPTTTPVPPTTTPGPTSTTPPPPVVNDLNCDDFPLADGRTAQQVLDADRDDPNVLDIDRDGIACEVNEQGNGGSNDNGSSSNGGSTSGDTDLNPGPISYSQVESVPQGGVETGA